MAKLKRKKLSNFNRQRIFILKLLKKAWLKYKKTNDRIYMLKIENLRKQLGQLRKIYKKDWNRQPA